MPLPLPTALVLAAAVLAGTGAAAFADEVPLLHDLGTRHRFAQPVDSPYLPVGCKDHRTLMYVVRGIQSDDPGAAQLLAGRDCRQIVPGEYVRCGPGGWAYPSQGERIAYASYCRVGTNDLPFYVLDVQMPLISDEAGEPKR